MQQHDPHRAERDRVQAALERLDVARRSRRRPRAAAARRSPAGASRGSRRRSPSRRRCRPRRRSPSQVRRRGRARRRRRRPRSPRPARRDGSQCQSWLPRTAKTGHAEVAAGIGQHRALLGLARGGEVAGEQQQVRLSAQAREALDAAARVVDAAVHVAGGGDAQRVAAVHAVAARPRTATRLARPTWVGVVPWARRGRRSTRSRPR